nr:hypothetical protein [Candidatus Woesearchaeota archaeon]
MKMLDSKIVEFNNEKYLVYTKLVNVKRKKNGENAKIIKAFVKKLKK